MTFFAVVSGNDFAIWRSLGNQSCPGLYFFGTDGRLRHRVLGEGSYGQSERVIQQLLSDASTKRCSTPVDPIDGQGTPAEPDADNLRSGEAYIGCAQSSGFASPEGVRQDTSTLPVRERACCSADGATKNVFQNPCTLIGADS
jgi:hypothetical protein